MGMTPARNKPCPKCGGQLGTKDSRQSTLPGVLVRRRLVCHACGAAYTSHEVLIEEAADMTVPHLTAVFVHDRAVAAVSRAIADAMAPLLDGIDTDRIGAIRQALTAAGRPR